MWSRRKEPFEKENTQKTVEISLEVSGLFLQPGKILSITETCTDSGRGRGRDTTRRKEPSQVVLRLNQGGTPYSKRKRDIYLGISP